MNDDSSRNNARKSEDLEMYARQVDHQLADSVDNLPGSSALDPGLWTRIRREAGSKPRKRPHRPDHVAARTEAGYEVSHGSVTNQVSPKLRWRWASAAFLTVSAVLCVLMILPGETVEPKFGSTILEAPLPVTPEPETEGCSIEPLTSQQVLEIVLDPGQVGWIDDRSLFATPPPPVFEYAHTQTWLPESNGTVDVAGGQRQVRTPTAAEFRESRLALDLYLRCQEEGTNYQLWALESPIEAQRHILTQTLADAERGWPEIETRGLEDVTETMILETIERLGPERRVTDGYLIFHAPDGLITQPNPRVADALVADNPASGEIEYAWIATEWTNPATGEIVSTRGAALDAMPTREADGSMPNLVVMILTFDAGRDQWLVEWFVPTI